MGTPLQTLYDRFQIKLDEDITGKEDIIFALVDVAIGRAYKAISRDLSYSLTDADAHEGSFNETLIGDEIDLLALWMLYEWNRRRQQRLAAQKDSIGTSDFNRLPDKVSELKAINMTMQSISDEIKELSDSMNTYKYY